MMSRKRRFPKIFLFFFLALLFLGLGLFYNQNRKTLAQEEVLLECEEEIPIGEAIDEAIDFATKIDQQLQVIYTAPGTQIAAAKSLFELPEECKAGNCSTGCDITSQEVCTPVSECNCREVCLPGGPGPVPCVRVCDTDCPDDCQIVTTCEILPCSGQACPFGEIANQLSQVENAYSQIKGAKEEIERLIRVDRVAILDKLERARNQMAGCAVSAEAIIEGQVRGEKMLLSCEEATYQRLLPEGRTCRNPNNFFCCETR